MIIEANMGVNCGPVLKTNKKRHEFKKKNVKRINGDSENVSFVLCLCVLLVIRASGMRSNVSSTFNVTK